ncbi:hypothetical protein [Salinigranum sp. GCM10025319]|uniref:hypothetical protein n=1 Tax=Salinigranum sp. GCM10025319 TaxID=3252687 RepID=UPI00362202DC
MPGFTTRLADGWQRALGSLSLALVPLVIGLTNVGKARSIAAFDGVHVGFRVGVPASVVTVWQFVSVPQTGVNVDPGVPVDALPVAVVSVPLLLVVQAALAAGYFGCLADDLAGDELRFVGNVADYFVPFLVLTVLPVLVLFPVALGLFGVGGATAGTSTLLPLVLVGIVAFLVVSYLFYLTPYLVVLRDVGVLAAARGAYGLAVAGGPYLRYTAGVALFVLVLSPVVTVVVVNVPVVGLAVGHVAGSVVGLALNVTTMRFAADVDPASPSTEWADRADDPSHTRSGV